MCDVKLQKSCRKQQSRQPGFWSAPAPPKTTLKIFERSALHLACAQAMRDQPSGQRPGSSRARAARGQTRSRSAPATTPAPGLRRDALKLLAGAACASLARCAHSLTSPATTLWSTGSPWRLWPGWAISRSQAKRCESLGLGTRRGSMARDFQYRAKKNPSPGQAGFSS